jgi:hypothetical protein
MAYKKVCVLAKMLQNRALTMEDKGLVIVSEKTTMASKIEHRYLKMSSCKIGFGTSFLRILDILG